MNSQTFEAHDAALSQATAASYERAEAIEALAVSIAYLATLPVKGWTIRRTRWSVGVHGGYHPPTTEHYSDTASRLAIILSRLAHAQQELAAHVVTQDDYTPSPLLRREILALDATDAEKADLLNADWPAQTMQPQTCVEAMQMAQERLTVFRREYADDDPCMSFVNSYPSPCCNRRGNHLISQCEDAPRRS